MLNKGQVSFFVIAGLVIVVLTAAMLATTSRITATNFEAEAAKQAALNGDRILLEWYIDELIRAAILDSINGIKAAGIENMREEIENAAEKRIEELFDNTQFNRRGAGVLSGNATVSLKIAERNIVINAGYPVTLQREWGETGISSRSMKIEYNLNRLYRFTEKLREDIAAGNEVYGEQEFEGEKFIVVAEDDIMIIKDYSLFWNGKPVEVIFE
jgi:hypothetical protein